MCAWTLVKHYGINQFKFDGIGSPARSRRGSAFARLRAAMLKLIDDLRALKPDLYINQTTGTWPSPFWLLYADSIWRGGEDHSFVGERQPNAQRWITYRDNDVYGASCVSCGPLYPLNSLMLHGIIYARHAPNGLNADPYHDFADEVHDYFATGTGLQEMYISAQLLGERDWDTLAEAAKWSRAHAETLRDSHWIGGDPARLEVYGWASWSPGHAIVALRNPSDRPQAYTLKLADALELPEDAPSFWKAEAAFADANAAPAEARALSAGVPVVIELKPFEVLVWDLAPAASAR